MLEHGFDRAACTILYCGIQEARISVISINYVHFHIYWFKFESTESNHGQTTPSIRNSQQPCDELVWVLTSLLEGQARLFKAP